MFKKVLSVVNNDVNLFSWHYGDTTYIILMSAECYTEFSYGFCLLHINGLCCSLLFAKIFSYYREGMNY